MILDQLKSCYVTRMRVRLNPELIATVRWYFAPPGALPLPGETAFGSSVWETPDREYPQPDLGEIDLTRTWDPGIAPYGVSGKETPTPLSWYTDGVPAEVKGPLMTCPGSLPAAPLVWVRPEELADYGQPGHFPPWPHALNTIWDVWPVTGQALPVNVDASTGLKGITLFSFQRITGNPPRITTGHNQANFNKTVYRKPVGAPGGLADFTLFVAFRGVLPELGGNGRFAIDQDHTQPGIGVFLGAPALTYNGPGNPSASGLDIFSVRREGAQGELRQNAALLTSGPVAVDPWTATFMQCSHPQPALTWDNTSTVFEVLLWPRALAPVELAAVDAYLAKKYQQPPPTPEDDVLIGTVIWDAGSDAVPANYLLCDGSAVDRATYSLLFGRIGTSFGPGDGSTTFNLPDLRDRSPIGSGGLYALGQQLGEAAHTLTSAEVPATPLTITDPGHDHAFSGNSVLTGSNVDLTTPDGLGPMTGWDNGGAVASTDPNTIGISGTVAGGGGPHNNLQPSLGLRPLIYAGA